MTHDVISFRGRPCSHRRRFYQSLSDRFSHFILLEVVGQKKINSTGIKHIWVKDTLLSVLSRENGAFPMRLDR